MPKWYDKYLSIYGKPFDEVSDNILDEIKEKLRALQSEAPLISIVVIAYNEERRLASCLWSLSELQTKYPIEIIGVNNNSKDCTEEDKMYPHQYRNDIATEHSPIRIDGQIQDSVWAH